MEDPRIISALFIFLKMAYYNVLINSQKRKRIDWDMDFEVVEMDDVTILLEIETSSRGNGGDAISTYGSCCSSCYT